MIKKIACVFLASMVILTSFGGCNKKTSKTASNDILTQKVSAEGKIPVTVLVKHAFSINAFEKAAEEKFPELDIIQVGNYTSDMGINEYAARMEHDDLTDLVMTWPLEVGEEYWDDRLIELSAMPFTKKYVNSMLDNISRNGKLYYLPGPSQVRGIVYNKTLFEEKSWTVPTDFNSFIALCKKIEESGMRSLQLGLSNSEVLDTAFFGFGYDSSLSKPQNAQSLLNYNNGQGSFGDNFAAAFDTFQTLIDEGVLKPDDLTIGYARREEMIFNRECAMVEDSVLLARMGEAYNGCTDEFALMPFFNPGVESDWSRLYPVCYIGVNKKLEQKENKQKLELVTKLLEYISTPEGQLSLASDTGAMFSSLNDVPPPNIPEIQDLLPSLTHGRYAIFPTLKNAQHALQNGLAEMVKGEMTAEDVIKMVDKENLSPPEATPTKVFGSATSDFTLVETGNFLTDIMREQIGCEIALFLDNGKDGQDNGKGINGKIYKGDITDVDIKRIMPDLKQGENGELLKVTMTGENLMTALEYAIPVKNNQEGWFYYFSGLKMEYNPTAQSGNRIKSITTSDGKAIDPEKKYSVAVMDLSVPENLIDSSESTGIIISSLFEQEIIKIKEISPSNDNRYIIATQ